MILHPVADGLWLHRVSHRVLGVDLGRQLVVATLPPRAGHDSPSLWIQSPIVVTPELRSALDELGEVHHVMAASRWHDECLTEFQTAYPEATFHATAGLASSRRDVRFGTELSDTPDAAWAGSLDQHVVRGMPQMNEVVFIHRASRSLILSDLAMNFRPPASFGTRFALTLAGAWNRFGPTRLERFLMKDRRAVLNSIDTILAWDFDRIIVGHGSNIETGGKTALAEAFAFLRR